MGKFRSWSPAIGLLQLPILLLLVWDGSADALYRQDLPKLADDLDLRSVDCHVNPCQNEATCVPDESSLLGVRCLCAPAYRGDLCQELEAVQSSGTVSWKVIATVCGAALLLALLACIIGLLVRMWYDHKDLHTTMTSLQDKLTIRRSRQPGHNMVSRQLLQQTGLSYGGRRADSPTPEIVSLLRREPHHEPASRRHHHRHQHHHPAGPLARDALWWKRLASEPSCEHRAAAWRGPPDAVATLHLVEDANTDDDGRSWETDSFVDRDSQAGSCGSADGEATPLMSPVKSPGK